jgi:hypothetical protein
MASRRASRRTLPPKPECHGFLKPRPARPHGSRRAVGALLAMRVMRKSGWKRFKRRLVMRTARDAASRRVWRRAPLAKPGFRGLTHLLTRTDREHIMPSSPKLRYLERSFMRDIAAASLAPSCSPPAPSCFPVSESRYCNHLVLISPRLARARDGGRAVGLEQTPSPVGRICAIVAADTSRRGF